MDTVDLAVLAALATAAALVVRWGVREIRRRKR